MLKRIIKQLLMLLVFSFPAGVQAQAIQVGKKAPEIALPSPKGDTIKLSSMLGKVVLIDFWASWCGPCVQEQPQLRKLYTGFARKPANFEILGVSLDSKKPAWENAIRKAGISWPQVSDLKFWMSPVTSTYEIEALPFNLLVDKSGKIVSINLHGKELEAAIASELSRTEKQQ